MFYYYDPTYWLIILGAIVALYAQIKVSTTYSKWSKVPSSTRMTGAQMARQILDGNGCENVRIERISGKLTDHYDPENGVLRLSSEVYSSDSVAALGVAAHEAGHAKLGHYENTVNRAAGLGIASAILGNLLGGGIGSTAANVGANLAYAGWSREQEVEADDYSVHLAYSKGEDPVGLYSAMLKLSNNGGRTQPSGFNSHPPDERRLLHIRNEILSIKPNAKFPDGSEKKAKE